MGITTVRYGQDGLLLSSGGNKIKDQLKEFRKSGRKFVDIYTIYKFCGNDSDLLVLLNFSPASIITVSYSSLPNLYT